MLVSIQLPIIDLRGFICAKSRLSSPTWPSPEADVEFLRAFGPIRRRPFGGLNGWLGEATVCDASRGAVFNSPFPKIVRDRQQIWFVRSSYRRFFFDGLATGKIEFGFTVKPESGDDFAKIDILVSKLLNIELNTENQSGTPIAKSATPLAQRYARATTSHSYNSADTKKFVLGGRPCVCIENSGQPISIPPRGTTQLNPQFGSSLQSGFLWHQRENDQDIPIWYLRYEKGFTSRQTRHLRICLARFHAETEALAKVLKSVSADIINPEPRSAESDHIQRFFLENLRHQNRAGRQIDTETNIQFYHNALYYRDYALPGYYDGLVSKLKNFNPRKNVLRNIVTRIRALEETDRSTTLLVEGDFVMTKVVNSGTAGIVAGSVNSHNSNIATNQNMSSQQTNPSLEDLRRLSVELLKHASSPDEKVAAESVKNAVSNLEAGDESGALAWLKHAGSWSLKMAEAISAKVAAEMIVRASTM